MLETPLRENGSSTPWLAGLPLSEVPVALLRDVERVESVIANWAERG